MPTFSILFCVLVANALSTNVVRATSELVALAPASGMAENAKTSIQWVNVTYPVESFSSVSDVTMTVVTTAQPQLGDWFNLDPQGLALTAKIHDNVMYALKNDGSAPNDMGCCANLLRMYPRDDGNKYTDLVLEDLIKDAVNASDAYASHTFDVTEIDSKTVAIFQVRYSEAELNGAPSDALVAIDVMAKTVVPTRDGKSCFNIFREAGTISTDPEDSRFKIQFYVDDGQDQEEWVRCYAHVRVGTHFQSRSFLSFFITQKFLRTSRAHFDLPER